METDSTVVRYGARATRATLLAAVIVMAGACASTGSETSPSPFPRAPAAQGVAEDREVAARGRAILATALALRGAAYRAGGDEPRAGFDCSGFVRYVFLQHTIVVPRTVAQQFRVGKRIARNRIQAGDLVFFNTTGSGASHVGIAIDGGAFVHAPVSGGVVRVERLDASYWRTRVAGVRRITTPSDPPH